MLTTSKLLTITVPKTTYTRIRTEASRRKSSISGLLRDAFESYTRYSGTLYSDQELQDIIKRDQLPAKFRKELDDILAS